MAHPPSGRPVPADVGEGFVIVAVRSAEGHLLYGLVHDEVLGDTKHSRGESHIKSLKDPFGVFWLHRQFLSQPLVFR